ncbi:translocation/assembly module TamB [Flavobacterium sp. ZT3R18]|uniref:translocation/assembly module TamB domain-containing protein n=1 Tax=Flavobacterium sp. ZT3R18 TaxID=2594429 RepID=UPI001179FE7B|nr:translocation/assembly module TamB [Flavobacterium sp. ZT3R18]TRX36046.1 translocation/assembly module TamB [Flavobacterium sp. ZT3R18]
MNKTLQKIISFFRWTVATMIVLLILLLILVHIPSVQNFTKEKVVNYLQDKIQTKVSIDSLSFGITKKIILKGVYFEDRKKDTLLSSEKLAIDISLLQLLNNKIEINSVELEGATATIKKDKNAVYNFDYIIKAFDTGEKPKDDSKPMVFSLEEIDLNRIHLKYSDAIAQNDVSFGLKHLGTHITNFDLEQMSFEIPKIKVNGLQLKIKQGIAKTPIKTNKTTSVNPTTPDLKLKLGEIDLSKLLIDYTAENSKVVSSLSMKKMLVKFNAINLSSHFIAIENLDLSDTKGALTLGKITKTTTKKATVASTPNNWEVKINKTYIKEVGFKFDNNNVVHLTKGIDYNHLNVEHFNLRAETLNYTPESTAVTILSLSTKEQSGLNIESFKTDFFYGQKVTFLKNLYLKTPQTLIKDKLILEYPSISSITENPGEVNIKTSLKQSRLGFKDILLFAPTLANSNPFKSNPNAILLINSKISGKLKNIEIPNLEVSGLGKTKIHASGKIVGLPDMKKARFDIKLKEFKSSSKDINSFVPKGTIPNSFVIPSQLSASGTFKGTLTNFYTNVNLLSSLGNAKVKASFDQTRKNREKYDAQAELTNFDLGKFIKNDSIGKITLKANVKGIGLNPKTAIADFNGSIEKAYFNKYTYQNLNLKGNLNKGNFNGTADAKDPNLTFNLESNGALGDKYPKANIKLNVDIADLEKLNLHAGPLKLRGEVLADIQTADIDYPNGKILFSNIQIENEKESFTLDSIQVTAITSSEKNEIKLYSPLLDAEINGHYKLSKLAAALSHTVANYYDTTPATKKERVANQKVNFNLDVKNSLLFSKFIPELKSIDPFTITGRYNSENDSIVINGTIPKIIYKNNTISNVILKVDTQDKALVYNLNIDDIESPNYKLPYTSLTGKVKDNTIDYHLLLKDLNDKDRYTIAGTLKTEKGDSEISLNPENLLLNYEKWKITPDNLIRLDKNGIYANNFELRNNGNRLKLQSESEAPNAPLSVNFENFEIETISNMLGQSDLQMGGKINGNALLKDLNKRPVFTSDLTIEDFSFKKDTVGTISIKVNNEIANQYDATVSITGQGNQVNLEGNYKPLDNSLDMNLIVEKLNMKSIQGFSMNHLTESTGFLNGTISITGDASQPKVVGELKFNDVGFKVKELNSKFKSINDTIEFNNNTIAFDHFTIKDEKDNDLVINGIIDSKNFRNLEFDLTVDADNFMAMNSKAKDNDLYYGVLFIDNHLKIKGTLDNPVVEGNIKINKDTKLTMVLPQSDPSVASREGIVEFIDQDQIQIIKTVEAEEPKIKSTIKGLNASVNIEIDKDAEFFIIIDKSSGDYIRFKGNAFLNGGIDPSGKTTLTGKFEFDEGAYEMTFSTIKRKFDIKKGSYIQWNGEPTSADINITAIYKTTTAPIDLLQKQLANFSDEVKNTFKEKIPFETKLIIKGELMKPDITFDIILPTENSNTISSDVMNRTQKRLSELRQDPNELNKQVLSLLLMNRFIGEDPFSSEAGGTSVSAMAKSSASQILTNQMNNLTKDLIQGVELNFDLKSTEVYSSGQREDKTDLNVGVTKKLLNDRLKVTVGSSFGLEGPQHPNQQSTNFAGDVTLDYLLSKDGKYKLKAYRVNKYQVALQGEVMETGIGFTITMDYNHFKELFQKKKDKKERLKVSKKKKDE